MSYGTTSFGSPPAFEGDEKDDPSRALLADDGVDERAPLQVNEAKLSMR